MYNVPSLDIGQIFALFFNAITFGLSGGITAGPLAVWWDSFFPVYRGVATFVSLLLITGILYAVVRLMQIRTEEHMLFHEQGHAVFEEHGQHHEEEHHENEAPGKAKWQVVENHLASENPGDWRLAILEADIILDELVRTINPNGDSLGERLKTIDKSDFRTLDKAWEAHKIRNAIAHEGADFMLSQREARRIASLFEEVFREFNYI